MLQLCQSLLLLLLKQIKETKQSVKQTEKTNNRWHHYQPAWKCQTAQATAIGFLVNFFYNCVRQRIHVELNKTAT